MKITFVTNGDPERIPPVGSRIKIKDHVLFEVEGYGESVEQDYAPSPTGKMYNLELFGHIVIPAGSPLSALNEVLKGEV